MNFKYLDSGIRLIDRPQAGLLELGEMDDQRRSGSLLRDYILLSGQLVVELGWLWRVTKKALIKDLRILRVEWEQKRCLFVVSRKT